MSFGKNLQYLRQLSAGMTQETLAEKLNVSRQTISKWEMDAANPEMDKALEICKIFNCTLDNLFREEIDKRSDAYSDLRTEEVKGFRYVEYTVISREPEADAIGRMCKCAEENGKGVTPEGYEIKEQAAHKYAAIHIDRPFDNPYSTISGAYHTLGDYMRTNGLAFVENEVIPCFETDGESMDIYMACK